MTGTSTRNTQGAVEDPGHLEFAVSVTYSRAEETQNQIFISADDELKALHRLLFEFSNGTCFDRCVFYRK
jgi:hypothetical protein